MFTSKSKARAVTKPRLHQIIQYRDGNGFSEIDSEDPTLVLFNCKPYYYHSDLIFRREGEEFTTIIPYSLITKVQADLRKDYYTNMLTEDD